jgi:hypothetical protein
VQLDIDYDKRDLDTMGKTFREFKLGVERVIKADLLPSFAADKNSRIKLTTLAFPSPRKMKKSKEGHYILEK